MPANLKSIVREVWPYLLLGLLCAAFFWRIWTPNPADRASFARGDFSGQFYAFARYQSERMRGGQLPLWNPYVSAGQPFAADIQSAAFYPPRWISIGLSGPGGFSYFALELEAIAHIFLAGAFTFAFAKRLFGDPPAALASAIVFAFGGYLTSYPILQLAILETIAWLPLILLLIDQAVTSDDARSRNNATIGAGLVWGVCLLAGHPQTAMLVIYLALVYGAWSAYTRLVSGTQAIIRLAAFVLIGLAAASAQWIPSLEFLQHSTRSDFGYDALSGGFPPRDIIQMLLPGTTSLWSPLYIGVLPLVLAMLSGLGERRRVAWFWLATASAAFVLSIGGATFLYNVLYQWLPGFDLFRSQERAASIVSFALAIAAGSGLAVLRSPNATPSIGPLRRTLFWSALGLIVLIGVLFVVWQLSRLPDVMFALDRGILSLLLVVASIGLLKLRVSLSSRRRVWTGLAIGLIVFDLFTINWQTDLEKRPPEAQTLLPDFLDAVRADPDLVRTDSRAALTGNWGNLVEVQSVNGASPLVIEAYARLRDALPKEREWKMFNVKYVISPDDSLGVPAEAIAQEVWEGKSLNLFRLSSMIPRAWIVHRVRAMDDASALTVLADPRFDLLMEAIISEPVPLSDAPGLSSARITEYEAERIVMDVEASAAGVLIVGELNYPGWRAMLDGEEVPTLRANVALRAVAIPSGHHRVEMIFQPVSVGVGLWISGVSWVIGPAVIALLIRKTDIVKAHGCIR